jgi:hypothetical protein
MVWLWLLIYTLNMKYIKRFEHIDYNENPEIISDLEEILQDLNDNYFDVYVNDRSYKNLNYLQISLLKDETGGLAAEFYLKDIYDVMRSVYSYLESNGLEIVDIDSFDLRGRIELPKYIENWDSSILDKKVLSLNFYFD